jgi:hypothetical protein
MKKVAALTIGLILALGSSSATTSRQAASEDRLMDQQQAIRVTITTGGGLFGPPRDRFEVGEQVPITITMTNTSSQPAYACVTSPMYQDLPQLTKGGNVFSYTKWQSYEMQRAEENATCRNKSLPERVLLEPNKPTVVDWFVLIDDASLDADGWYDPLSPGDYQLSIQRRVGCCDGPMVESNKINFQVVP